MVLEYVSAPLEIEMDASEGVADFQNVLNRFGNVEQLLGTTIQAAGENGKDGHIHHHSGLGEAGSDSDEDDLNVNKISRKQKKLAARANIAELKQACDKPEVVEVWDATSADPVLLVHLKAYRNSVPVPQHWSQKRAYLAGKKGLEKPPFKLPAFIEATGITEMRQAYLEKAESQTIKQKGRERMRPGMGKLDIDYQILHDAFFRHQTRPPMTAMGDLYYEGKEFDVEVKHARPGVLSEQLRAALGMELGAPPPWLVNMQRYGPPPSYPSLRIPGLNAPIPPGAQFGYHPGGWGKPPVDEEGNPIYGDVFAERLGEGDDEDDAYKPLLMMRWGELEEEGSEEEVSSEEEEEEEEEEESEQSEEETLEEEYANLAAEMAVPSGIETPREVVLRKADEGPKQLYQVLEQEKTKVRQSALMGSEYAYKVPGEEGGGEEDKKLTIAARKRLEMLRQQVPSDVEVALDPTELETLDDAALRELYEGRVAELRKREDFSDLVAAKAAAQKRKATEKQSGKQDKKFKF